MVGDSGLSNWQGDFGKPAGDIEHFEVGATPYLAVANREGN